MLRLALVCLTACAAVDPGVRKPTAPPPAVDGVMWADTTFTGHGVTLYAQSWRPAGDVKAVVAIHHGLADHGGRYAAFAQRLARAVTRVWAMDMRGHGRSAGERVRADDMDDFLDDLDAFVALVPRARAGQAAVCDGSLARRADRDALHDRAPSADSRDSCCRDRHRVRRTAATGRCGVQVIAALAPAARVLATPHGDFSSSPAVIDDMNKDDLIYQGGGEARTARAAIDGARRVWAAPGNITMPLLVVAGSIDKLVAPSGGRDLVKRAGTKDASFILYEQLNHDLLHEPGADRVMTDIQSWLDVHVAGTPAAPPALPDGPVKGDRGASLASVELDIRGDDHDGVGVTGGLRARFGFGPYVGGLDLRAGVYPDGRGALYEADLHALGVGLSRSGALVTITGGVGIGGLRGASATHLPVELALEAPLGPIRALARVGLGWRLSGPSYATDVHGVADEVDALIGVRLGRDHHYWSRVVAGAGPYIGVAYRDLGGVEFYGVAVGIDMFGAE